MKIVLKLELADEELRAIEYERTRKFRKPTKNDVRIWLNAMVLKAMSKTVNNYLDDPDVRKKRAKARINAQAKANGGSYWSSPKVCGTADAFEILTQNAAKSGEEN